MQDLTFEQAMNRLEEIVNQLEQNNVSLDESVSLFQEGMELSKYCKTKLDSIEDRVSKIMIDGKLQDFSIDE